VIVDNTTKRVRSIKIGIIESKSALCTWFARNSIPSTKKGRNEYEQKYKSLRCIFSQLPAAPAPIITTSVFL